MTGATTQTNALLEDENKARCNRLLKSDLKVDTSALMADGFNEQLCKGLSARKVVS
jgi:hypothetical protein